jgi:hypothetical protein
METSYSSTENIITDAKLRLDISGQEEWNLRMERWVVAAEIDINSFISLQIRYCTLKTHNHFVLIPEECLQLIRVYVKDKLMWPEGFTSQINIKDGTVKNNNVVRIEAGKVYVSENTEDGTEVHLQYAARISASASEVLVPETHKEAVIAYISWKYFSTMTRNPRNSNMFKHMNDARAEYIAKRAQARSLDNQFSLNDFAALTAITNSFYGLTMPYRSDTSAINRVNYNSYY